MTTLPVFGLGTVVVPTSVVPLHLFEPRYLTLMDHLTAPGAGDPEFGIVLIERGSEVGGGDVRMSVGTVVRILETRRLPDDRWLIAVAGTRRFRVDRWLPDDPYPRAETTDLVDAGGWDRSWDGLLADATRAVRRAAALASELGETATSVGFELDPDPSTAAWQLGAIVPLGAFDRQRLLETEGTPERLRLLASMAEEASSVLEYRLRTGP